MDLSSLLPRDESSQGFDNITVTDLSPTLLESYVSAADKISRLAVGRPVSFLAVETIKMKPDFTQEWPRIRRRISSGRSACRLLTRIMPG